ncbi:predicted protein, partial [Arabidopsis lyrata subsp. lyrata]
SPFSEQFDHAEFVGDRVSDLGKRIRPSMQNIVFIQSRLPNEPRAEKTPVEAGPWYEG